MFGLTHKLSDSLLYMTHDMVENLLLGAEQSLTEIPVENIEEIAQINTQIENYKQNLKLFEEDIELKRLELFQFSIEELYYMYGQYDKFVGIEFHKFSESAKKFGRNIGGTLVYGKNERQSLETIITSENIPRTNGLVKIDVSTNYNLKDQQLKELISVGFMSDDIYEILNTNTILVNSYTHKGKKEIPNSINLDFDTKNINPCKLALHILNLQLKNGGSLIDSQWNRYCGYNIYYSPELIESELIKSKLYNIDGSRKKEVRLYELIAKKYNSDISNEELNEFSELLKNRINIRLEILKEELKKNNINSLLNFMQDHSAIFMEIYKTAIGFEDEMLSNINAPSLIYWDFKSYLHIFLRHCEELQPDGYFKSKTPFAYCQKDIRRILQIAIEKLEDKIHARLSQGLDFRTYGEKALYFNGNYYSMRIESDGRVDSFHPNEYK